MIYIMYLNSSWSSPACWRRLFICCWLVELGSIRIWDAERAEALPCWESDG